MYKTLLITLDFPPNIGGVASYWRGLLQNLPADKLVVLAPPPKDYCQKVDYGQGYIIYRKKLLNNFLWPKWLPLLFHIYKIVKKEKIEILIAAQILPVGTACWLISKILSCKYIISCHGLDILLAQKSKRKIWLANKILSCASHVISNSKFTKNELIKLGFISDKITVIYPCPSLISKQTTDSSKQNLIKKYQSQDKKILLSVGRLVKRKGFDLVIKALPKVLKEFPNLVYLIVGEGPESLKLKDKSLKLNLGNKVIFCGFVFQEGLKAYYELGDIFIMTPQEINGDIEGFGLVYLEAGIFGKPVIGSFSGGVGEAVIDNVTGLLIKPNNIDEISQAIIKLLSNQDLARKLGERGRERVLREFKWEEQAKKLTRLLN